MHQCYQCKTAVCPLLMNWRCCSPAISHWLWSAPQTGSAVELQRLPIFEQAQLTFPWDFFCELLSTCERRACCRHDNPTRQCGRCGDLIGLHCVPRQVWYCKIEDMILWCFYHVHMKLVQYDKYSVSTLKCRTGSQLPVYNFVFMD